MTETNEARWNIVNRVHRRTSEQGLQALTAVPLLCGVIPALVAFTCYGLSVRHGIVPLCNVFWDGCTSVSAAGREAPAVFLFKGALLPTATLIALFWWLTGRWLRALGASAASARAIQLIGIVGALFLILYVTFLGSEGAAYRLMRRYGVIIYFSFTVLAQMLLARSMLASAPERTGTVARVLTTVCVILLVLGLGVTTPEAWIDVPSRLENSVEWIYAVLMHVNFGLCYFAWRRTDFNARLDARPFAE